jgi:hypothetical protein
MNKNTPERQMIQKYWHETGGTLIWEFPMVRKTKNASLRRLDALIIPSGERRETHESDIPLKGKDVVLVQAKNKRLGMTLMGQAVFSVELMKRFKPASIRCIALCTGKDEILGPLLEPFREVEVVVIETMKPIKNPNLESPLP